MRVHDNRLVKYKSTYFSVCGSSIHLPILCFPFCKQSMLSTSNSIVSRTHARIHTSNNTTYSYSRRTSLAYQALLNVTPHTPNIQIHDVYLTQRVAMCILSICAVASPFLINFHIIHSPSVSSTFFCSPLFSVFFCL